MSDRKLTSRHDRSWVPEAACASLGADQISIFVADEIDRREGAQRASDAKAVCGGCPVADLCLAYAVENGISIGIWGGTTPRARRSMTAGQIDSGTEMTASLAAELDEDPR